MPVGTDTPTVPSTLVHLAIGGLVAAALLRETFGWRSLAVVMAATAVPDLDTFVGLVLAGAHRSLLHTLLFPTLLGVGVVLDARRPNSWLCARFDGEGVRVAWVALAALVLGGIGPDLATNGVNYLYPLTDQFVRLDGHLRFSTQRGIVQTFVQPSGPDAGGAVVGTTKTLHYSTGVDPSPGAEPAAVERVFPLVDSGLQLLLVVASSLVLAVRLRETKR